MNPLEQPSGVEKGTRGERGDSDGQYSEGDAAPTQIRGGRPSRRCCAGSTSEHFKLTGSPKQDKTPQKAFSYFSKILSLILISNKNKVFLQFS